MRRRSSHLLLGMLIVLAIATRTRAAEPSRITLAVRMAVNGIEWVTATVVAAEAVEGKEVRAALQLGERVAVGASVRPGRNLLRRLSPQPGFISPYPVPLQVALLGLILGGIWTTYGYVVWLLLQIRRAR